MTTPIETGVLWLAAMTLLLTTIFVYAGLEAAAVCLGVIALALLYSLIARHAGWEVARHYLSRRGALLKDFLKVRSGAAVIELISVVVVLIMACFLWIPLGLLLAVLAVCGFATGVYCYFYIYPRSQRADKMGPHDNSR